MPSSLHETLIEMFRHRPSLAAELLVGALGMDLPAYQQARVDPGECTDLTPTEYRADAVVVLIASQGLVLAVLSAMAHGSHPDRSGVLDALLGALAAVDEQRATLYSDVVLAALPVAARCYLEALMSTGTHEYQSEFVRRYVFQGRAEGKAEGEAMAVLSVLDARGIDVPEDARARITGCADLDQLERLGTPGGQRRLDPVLPTATSRSSRCES